MYSRAVRSRLSTSSSWRIRLLNSLASPTISSWSAISRYAPVRLVHSEPTWRVTSWRAELSWRQRLLSFSILAFMAWRRACIFSARRICGRSRATATSRAMVEGMRSQAPACMARIAVSTPQSSLRTTTASSGWAVWRSATISKASPRGRSASTRSMSASPRESVSRASGTLEGSTSLSSSAAMIGASLARRVWHVVRSIAPGMPGA